MQSLDNIITILNKRLDEVETKISAWEKVERKRTKAGKDFTILSKNFENAKIYDKGYHLNPSKELSVCGFSKFSGYVSDYIDTVGLVKYEKNRKISEDRIIKEPLLEPYYFKTADELFEDIEIKIENLREQKRKLEIDIEQASEVFGKFKEQIDSAVKELKATCNSNLYHQCIEYARGVY